MTLLELYLKAFSRSSISSVNLSTLRGVARVFGVSSELEVVDPVSVARIDPAEVRMLIAEVRAQRGLAPLSGGAARNYVALARSLIRCAQGIAGNTVPPALSAVKAKQMAASSRSYRDRVPPASLEAEAEFDEWAAWKMAVTLPPMEHPLRKNTWRAKTASETRDRLLRHWAWLERHLGRASTRLERFSPKLFQVVINEYLAAGKTPGRPPGFEMARMVASDLETACREYLPARYPEVLAEIQACDQCGDVAGVFAAYKLTFRNQAALVATPPGKSALGVQGVDLFKAGQRAIRDADLFAQRRGANWRKSEFRYRRGGLGLLILAEWPMRVRNLAALRWGSTLFRDADGRYRFTFRGEELKVAMRGNELNVYDGHFNERISAEIDSFREYLEVRFGPGVFEAVGILLPTYEQLLQARYVVEGEALDPLVEVGRVWLALTPVERERAARLAAEGRDVAALWALTVAHSELYESYRRPRNQAVLKRDRLALEQLLEHSAFDPLLAPPVDAWAQWERALLGAGLKSTTVAMKRVVVKHLYAALRWAGVTTADPLEGLETKELTGRYSRDGTSPQACLRDDMSGLTEKYLGVRLTPHRARNVLVNDAKAWGQATGADVWSLAAKKLNNSRLTVINEYDVPDNSRMHEFDARLVDED
jgi:hypothetical protein